MKTTFEQSKHFVLTKDEEEYLNKFLDMFLIVYGSVKDSKRNYVLNREIAEKMCNEVGERMPNVKNNNWGKIFARSVSEGCSGIKVDGSVISGEYPMSLAALYKASQSNQQLEWRYEKTLPDSSKFKFTHKELRKSLYDLGRFYFARQFDHRYDGLTSLNSYWQDLDNYVVQREEILKLDGLVKKLPELEGIF